MIVRRSITLLLAGLLATVLPSCDPWFSFSPYEAKLDKRYRDINAKNLVRINALDADDSEPFKIAVITDPHYHYSKLKDAVAEINRNPAYEFVIVAGDLTENGLMREFVFFYQVMEELEVPYLTTLGNHDYLANGEMIYEQMYGAFNYTFVYNNCKFVMWDNTTLESGKAPDMHWLADELDDEGYDHILPVAHIPPYDQQMKDYSEEYRALLEAEGLDLSIHGHKHDFSLGEVNGVRYLTASSPQKRTYTELSITATAVEIRKIEY